jgi:hypothetical protein
LITSQDFSFDFMTSPEFICVLQLLWGVEERLQKIALTSSSHPQLVSLLLAPTRSALAAPTFAE